MHYWVSVCFAQCKCLFSLIALEFCVLQTVSYARFLLPTNALVRQKSSGPPDISTAQTAMSRNRINGQKNFTPSRINSTVIQDTGELHVQIHYVLIIAFLCLFIGDFYLMCMHFQHAHYFYTTVNKFGVRKASMLFLKVSYAPQKCLINELQANWIDQFPSGFLSSSEVINSPTATMTGTVFLLGLGIENFHDSISIHKLVIRFWYIQFHFHEEIGLWRKNSVNCASLNAWV